MNKLALQYKEIFLGLIILLYLGYRFFLVSERYYDHDELQHLNATWSLASGQVPFLDFFEHHFPWLYHFSTFIFTIFNQVTSSASEAIHSIFFSRLYMQLFFISSIVIFYKSIKYNHSKLFSLIFVTLYITSVPMILKTIEFRPDVPALLFYSISLHYLVTSLSSLKQRPFYLSYLFFSIAIMFTQKYLMMLPAFVVCSLMCLDMKREFLRYNLKKLFFAAFTFMIPFMLTAIYYMINNALNEFIYYNLTLNFNWIKHAPHWYQTKIFTSKAIIPLILSILGFLGIMLSKFKSCEHKNTQNVFGIFYIWFLITLYLIPISALQYYIIFIPSMVYFSSVALIYLFKKTNFIPIMLIFIIILLNDNIFRKINSGYRTKQDFLITYITENTAPLDKVFVGNPNYALYRPSISFYHIIHEGIYYVMPEHEKRNIEEILSNANTRPKIVSHDWNLRTFFKNLAPMLQDHYHEVPGSLISEGRLYEYNLLELNKPLIENH